MGTKNKGLLHKIWVFKVSVELKVYSKLIEKFTRILYNSKKRTLKMTPDMRIVVNELPGFLYYVSWCACRHLLDGDSDEFDNEDMEIDNDCMKNGRQFTPYEMVIDENEKTAIRFCIITDADRKVTTILFQSEYPEYFGNRKENKL